VPIIHFHIAGGHATEAQEERLLVGASQLYAEILQSPIERVRAFLHVYPPARCAAGGMLINRSSRQAPYFEFSVLDGRPLDQRQRLLRAFTDLIVDILGVDRALVRGQCKRVAAEDWSIGGELASEKRAVEIKKFAETSRDP
jgi:phenylpyruvate tautomerase PptA (4-oxalocrotonate tautomerase family)